MNRETIEFRLFQGTLKYNTLIATLQLVNEICDVAIFMADEGLSTYSWSDFVGRLDLEAVPELIAYLKERRLYVTVFGAVAELEREYILQRQREGSAIAKRQGKYKGRKPIVCDSFKKICIAWKSGEITPQKLVNSSA